MLTVPKPYQRLNHIITDALEKSKIRILFEESCRELDRVHIKWVFGDMGSSCLIMLKISYLPLS